MGIYHHYSTRSFFYILKFILKGTLLVGAYLGITQNQDLVL